MNGIERVQAIERRRDVVMMARGMDEWTGMV
jgi:hypothetical protein